jgi:hypothetical protein
VRFIAAESFALTCRIKRCVLETGTARAIAARGDGFRTCVVANRFVEFLTTHRPCLARFVLIAPEYGAGVVVIGPAYSAGVVVVGQEYWAGLAVDGVQYGPVLVVFGTQYRPPYRVTRPASPYIVQAGSVIPAALIMGLRSDLPGQITAQVTENTFDSPSGRFLLIPQGARLIGTYDSQVTHGQSRILLVWTKLIMPNGRSMVLERQQGADTGGYAGLEDEVDQHWGELFKAALLSTLLGVGAELGAGADAGSGNSAVIQAFRRGAGDSLNQTGQQIVRRNLNMQPTLTIRPGFPVRVIINRDLVLEPYRV